MHDKENATIFALLRQFFAVIWPLKWYKATFDALVLFFFLEGVLTYLSKYSLKINRQKLENMAKNELSKLIA